MDDFERELKIGFLDEASQAVADVEQCFLSLESDPKNEEHLHKIFRLAHNLKGSSKAVGFAQFGAFTHEFENFILKIKNHELNPSPAVVNLLLQANDFVQKMTEGLKVDLDATFDFSDLLQQMKNPPTELTTSATETTVELAHEIPESPTEEVAQEEQTHTNEMSFELSADELELAIQKAQAEGEMSRAIEQAPPIAAPMALAPANEVQEKKSNHDSGGGSGASRKSSAPEENIRVALSKVESLINFVGEMVILQSVMREQAQFTDSLLLKKTVQMLGKVTKEIQETAMGLRMVPLKPVFQKMVRIVRDTGQALGKDVQIVLTGEDTELDKTVLEKVNDPLVHLIRNAVDHGIESPEKRVANGKNSKGTVHLKSYHQSSRLVIEVSDDGGGLNPAVLIKKAQEKGILKPNSTLSDKDAYALIFAPGFSTKEQVTDVSGRGVGMDVVRTNIQEMGGEVQIDSVLGKGTTFKIILPLTLAIIDAMVVTYSGEKFVLPLSHVHETVPTKDHKIQNTTGLGDILLLRGENLPLFRLGDLFGIKSTKTLQEMITVIVRTGPKPFALALDDILGQYQVVIKQLGAEFQNLKGIGGSTILGDGRPALILEPADLLKRKLTPGYQAPKTPEGVKTA